MTFSTFKKLGYVLVASCAVSSLTACTTGSNQPFRTYYTDASCQSYYVDIWGNKVYEGSYQGMEFTGLMLTQGSDGRWYYQDSYGNRIYKAKRCR